MSAKGQYGFALARNLEISSALVCHFLFSSPSLVLSSAFAALTTSAANTICVLSNFDNSFPAASP
ncbi:hypothetical protein D3C83_303910 [compost metagenome]